MTTSGRVTAPARAHLTVAFASPAWTFVGTVHDHWARPPAATVGARPVWVVPPK